MCLGYTPRACSTRRIFHPRQWITLFVVPPLSSPLFYRAYFEVYSNFSSCSFFFFFFSLKKWRWHRTETPFFLFFFLTKMSFFLLSHCPPAYRWKKRKIEFGSSRRNFRLILLLDSKPNGGVSRVTRRVFSFFFFLFFISFFFYSFFLFFFFYIAISISARHAWQTFCHIRLIALYRGHKLGKLRYQ